MKRYIGEMEAWRVIIKYPDRKESTIYTSAELAEEAARRAVRRTGRNVELRHIRHDIYEVTPRWDIR